MTPLCLVTGFLGSGKTTLLERFTTLLRGRRVVYLVNEMSSVDVDGRRLNLPTGEWISLPGGSIFCRCLVTEFIAALGQALALPGGPPDGIIVEASGIADPRGLHVMLRETRLDRACGPVSVVAVVDPGTFRKLLATLPNIRAQIEAADAVVINKTDLHAAADVAATEAEVRAIQPRVNVWRTHRCAVDFDPLAPAASWAEASAAGQERPAPRPSRCVANAGGSGEADAVSNADGAAMLAVLTPCSDPNFHTTVLRPATAADWRRLRLALDSLGGDLYRAKGFVPAEDGLRYVDFAAGRWTESRAEDAGRAEVVIIVRGEAREKVADWRRP